MRGIIARNHNFDPETPDAFDDWDSIANAEMVGKISDAMDAFLGAVGLVTLALGAMGVVNIMLVSVTERTREIGLRKALGATRRSILFQFFLEGLLLTTISGVVGVAAAYGATSLFGLAAADRWIRTASYLSRVCRAGYRKPRLGGNRRRALSRSDEQPCSHRWKLFVRSDHGSRERCALGSLCGSPAEPQAKRSHHAGHGLGDRHRGPVAGLWHRFFHRHR